MPDFVTPDSIRSQFSAAMSQMYRGEVPAYGDLIEIVKHTNQDILAHHNMADEDSVRLSEERHGAIRVGTADELAMIARIFKIMGMYPVSYYDLGSSGIPVHSTAFRPIERDALAQNPFRVFTSLLRLELIEDDELRITADALLKSRKIFTDKAISLTLQAELDGGLNRPDADAFVAEVLETFRWTGNARVNEALYQKLHDAHRLIADVVSFTGPHINHLTPRTLDIDTAQRAMIESDLPAKAVIEGPPSRNCPILLRQTSFKALKENVTFLDSDTTSGHTARFGEIEQRGIALTPKGRALYDALLAKVRAVITPAADGSNAEAYQQALSDIFTEFPDDWAQLYHQGLAYFRFDPPEQAKGDSTIITEQNQKLAITPIIYEDFLPVSAAGIFQSNLGDDATQTNKATASKTAFELALGEQIIDEFTLYQSIQDESLQAALSR